MKKGLLVILIVSVLFAFTLSAEAQVKKPRIYISVDIEGIAHVVNAQTAAGQFDYERGRRLMTAEVNAAIEGCLAAGAGEIVVSDSHGNAQNIIPEDLNEKAYLIRSFPRPLLQMEGIDSSFDGVIFIGYHPKEGTPEANLSHTIWGTKFAEIKMNGKVVSEALFNAAVAGHFGVPVIMVCGDQNVVKEAQENFGSVETVMTKESLGFLSAKSAHPKVVQAEIRQKAEKAVRRIKEMKPYTVAKPVVLDIAFKNIFDAETTAYLPWVKRTDGKAVRVEFKDMLEANRFLTALFAINNRT
ncbi:MAG: M55 family metallopeptidase [Candidatus Saccharicenans sp.]|jgi:D-amino peptidase|nr:M55 family metallopeptidase [Candidatus Saccharicenans sp.]MDH7492463.1 M55 family metallopeptidase [Candidatus Saccharicenans sp.]